MSKITIKDVVKVIFIVLITNGVLKGIVELIKKMIGGYPKRKHERSIENIKSEQAHKLQVDSYYRDVSTSEVSQLFNDWYRLAYAQNELLEDVGDQFVAHVNEMLNKTLAFGSAETVRRLAAFQSFNYQNEKKKEQNINDSYTSEDGRLDSNTYMLMYLVTYIIVSLKKDFTGHDIEPNDVLKIKIKDYKEYETFLEKVHTDVKKMLSQ